mmetsp:Transcript_58643/g.137792  ORF Transcript_58643/g.137792 Transcript_58643/m.137792 type:complete len:101 (+) Transcript_58643:163-465(+)
MTNTTNTTTGIPLASMSNALAIIHTPNTAALSVTASGNDATVVLPSREINAPTATAPAGSRFLPTDEWKEIEDGQLCPPGLEFRMNMSTGKNYARNLQNS